MTVTGAGVRVELGREGGESGVCDSVSRSSCRPAWVWATVSVVVLGADEVVVEGVAGLDGTDRGTCNHVFPIYFGVEGQSS